MAKTPVTLKIDGFKEREVAKVKYEFNRAIDKENQPTGIPRGGVIELTVKALNEGPMAELLNWMLNKKEGQKGTIEFMRSDQTDKKMKTITFERAYIVSYLENWEDQTGKTDLGHYETVVISCGVLKNEGAEFTNDWA